MDPALITLALQVLLKYGPEAYKAVVDLISNPAPTKDDFLKLLDYKIDWTEQSYVDAAKAAKG